MNNYFKVPDFVQLQSGSFLSFLQNGVKDEIRHMSFIQMKLNGNGQVYYQMKQSQKHKLIQLHFIFQYKSYRFLKMKVYHANPYDKKFF